MDFSQGLLPSCQTLATIGALSRNERGLRLLTEMLVKKGDVYEVRFPTLPDVILSVSSDEYEIPAGESLTEPFSMSSIAEQTQTAAGLRSMWVVYPSRPQRVSGDEIVRVLEIAYGKYQMARHAGKFAGVATGIPLQVYRHADFHYQADESLRDFTGWNVETICAGETTNDGSKSFAKVAGDKPDVIFKVSQQLAAIGERPQAFVATACSVGFSDSKSYLDPGAKILPWHDHVINSVDFVRKTVEVVDPFNSRIGLVLKFEDFLRYFCLIACATVP